MKSKEKINYEVICEYKHPKSDFTRGTYAPWEECNISEVEYWEKRYIESQKELKNTQEMIFKLFVQGTLNEGLYDHGCISTYEHVQDYLLEKGIITEALCRRK